MVNKICEKKLSDYFGIPYRTLQDWYYGNRKMPDHIEEI